MATSTGLVASHYPVLVEDDREEENYQVLTRLTDHFEQHHPGGKHLGEDEAGTRRAAKGTVGLRMRVARFEARAELNQNHREQPHLAQTRPVVSSLITPHRAALPAQEPLLAMTGAPLRGASRRPESSSLSAEDRENGPCVFPSEGLSG